MSLRYTSRALAQLSDGHASDMPGIRVLNLTRYPYRIYYRVFGESDVIVLRILHAARKQ